MSTEARVSVTAIVSFGSCGTDCDWSTSEYLDADHPTFSDLLPLPHRAEEDHQGL